jgi:autotransporter-associated beta strand protein
MFFSRKITILTIALCATLTTASRAVIVAPYTPDSATLHLWHLDQATPPVTNEVAGGTSFASLVNGATLGNASFSGFGNALSTLDGGAGSTAATSRDAILTPNGLGNNITITYMDPGTAAFTYEAILRIDWDPTQNLGTVANGGNGRNAQCQIMNAENNSNGGRIFQFRIDPIGTANPLNLSQPILEFINVHATSPVQNILAPIPTTGPDAIVQGNWYHVAVSYNGSPGTPDNLKMYWTLVDSSRIAANQILSTTLNQNLLNAQTIFALGNIPRTPNANFLGLIDEIRISKVVRSGPAMLFASPDVVIITPPSDTTVAVGQNTRFTVSAAGLPPLTYQWRKDGTALNNGTNAFYDVINAQLSDAGQYDVVVTNASSAATSAVAALTVRSPLNLNWTGLSSFDWDYVTMNWNEAVSSTPTNYSTGDNVHFDTASAGSGFVNLTAPLSPSSMTVDSDVDYDLLTLNGTGRLTGTSRLTKSGIGKLILEMDNNYTGPTTISAGTLQLGLNAGQGSFGIGPVTNNGAILFNRTGAFTHNDYFVGTGTLTLNGNIGLIINGTNTCSGDITLNAGALTLGTLQAQGAFTNVTVNASANNSGFSGTRFAISSGMYFPANVAISLLGTTASPDWRCAFAATSGSNVWNGPILATGSGVAQISSEGINTRFDVNGNVTADTLTGSILLRGTSGFGVMNGAINAPNASVNLTDNSTWILNSAGNSWTNTTVASGTFRMGGNNVLPSNAVIKMGQAGSTGTLDLNGFDQQIGGLVDGGGTEIISNSSSNSNAVLTLNSSASWTFGGSIQDVISGGTRIVGLTLDGGGTLTLRSNNTYSGETRINSGTLALSGVGAITNTTAIILGASATLDATARTDGQLNLGTNQTLRGDSNLNVNGSLANKGTIQLKLNKSGTTLTADTIHGLNQMTYGGTLSVVLSGDALGSSDTIKLFYATSYAGTFAYIIPSSPGAGLAWNTNGLAVDGTLGVMEAVINPPTISTATVSGSNIILSGTGGIAGHTYSVWASQDITAPRSSWVQVGSGTFDGGGNFSVTIGITPGLSQSFFAVRVP